MAKKAKKKMHRMPPLSVADKIIYWTAFVLLWLIFFAMSIGTIYLRKVIAFADESVAAAYENISFILSVFSSLTFHLTTLIVWFLLYEARRPILGKRNFKYGPPGWPKVYPLFMKNKPYVFVSEREKKNRRVIAAILVAVLLLSLILWPLSLCGRTCLHSDGSITQYNMFNKQMEEYSADQIEKIQLETCRFRHDLVSSGVSITLFTKNGNKHFFTNREFRKGSQADDRDWIAAMLDIKNQFDPGIVYCDETEKLKYVVMQQNLTAEETQLLYELFGLG